MRILNPQIWDAVWGCFSNELYGLRGWRVQTILNAPWKAAKASSRNARGFYHQAPSRTGRCCAGYGNAWGKTDVLWMVFFPLTLRWLRILSPFKWDSGRSASARGGLLSLWEPILKQPLITTTRNNSNSSLRCKVKRKIQSSLRSQHTRQREMLSLINKIHIPSNRKLCFCYKEILALPPKLLSTTTRAFKAKPRDILR